MDIGLAEAALRLAATYDPPELQRLPGARHRRRIARWRANGTSAPGNSALPRPWSGLPGLVAVDARSRLPNPLNGRCRPSAALITGLLIDLHRPRNRLSQPAYVVARGRWEFSVCGRFCVPTILQRRWIGRCLLLLGPAASSAVSDQADRDDGAVRRRQRRGRHRASSGRGDGQDASVSPSPSSTVPGGGGAVAFTHVTQQKPDGYAARLHHEYHLDELLFRNSALRPHRACARSPCDHRDACAGGHAPTRPGARSSEMVEEAKKNPGKFRIGNSGIGTHTHLSASALFLGAGATVIDVPFGEGQATVNLLGGRVEGVVQLPPALIGHVKSGDLAGACCARLQARSHLPRHPDGNRGWLSGRPRSVARNRRPQGHARAT